MVVMGDKEVIGKVLLLYGWLVGKTQWNKSEVMETLQNVRKAMSQGHHRILRYKNINLLP